MRTVNAGALYDPSRGDPAVRTGRLDLSRQQFEPARTNYFAICFIETGAGTFWADAASFAFGPNSLVFFVPYQHVRFAHESPVRGDVVQFHATFFASRRFTPRSGVAACCSTTPSASRR